LDGYLSHRLIPVHDRDSNLGHRPHAIVIGGGITGLAAAYRLRHTAPETPVTLLEATDHLGGKILTEHRDDFVIEAGPDSFLATKPRGVGLSQEVGMAECLQGVTPRERRAFVLFRERLHELPEGLTGLVPTRLAPLARSSLLSPAGKGRVVLDYVLPPRRAEVDESLGSFVRRRLGREAWERLVEPLMSGIYAADGDELSLMATFPQLREAERAHGGLIRGVLASRRDAPPTPPGGSGFLTPDAGLSEFVTVLADRLRDEGATIRTGVAVKAIGRHDGAFNLEMEDGVLVSAETVIVATPAFRASQLLSGLDRLLSADLGAIPHVSTAIVTLAYRRDEIAHPLPGHGYVVPRVERSPILACTWSSRKWEHRAPQGWELMRVFLGRSGHLQDEVVNADNDFFVALARDEVERRLGVATAPALARVHRWPLGMPQYHLGHLDRVARINSALVAHSGLFLAGNAYGGVGLPDCIASGERAAEAAAAYLGTMANNVNDNVSIGL
jgi:oxygen-dependent protoporphyrinogen oxidase